MATSLARGDLRINLAHIMDFSLGAARVRPALLEISVGSRAELIEPRVMQLLVALKRAGGAPVSRQDLIGTCWDGLAISDDAITQCVSKLRRALASIPEAQVESVPRVGYRLNCASPPREGAAIAVFPFSNFGGDPNQGYFVEGMMDEIVMALTRNRGLFVISSESSSALSGEDWEKQKAVAWMGVRYVLKGSVRRSGPRIRIAVKLVDALESVQVWAERFDYDLKDVFELQDRIALEVAAVIEPNVYEAEVRRVARHPVENLGSYDLYLRAAPLRATCRKAEVIQALELLDRALALDPEFGPALAQAAGCHSQIYENGWSEDREWHRTEGLILADRAVRNGAEDALVLAQAANAVMDLEGNVARAVALADRATAINPGCARAWFVSGIAHLLDHDADIAVEHLEIADRLDPISSLNDVIRAHIGVGRFLQGDFQGALRAIRATMHRSARIHLTLAALYGYLNMPRESQEELALFQSGSPLSPEDMVAVAIPQEKSRNLLLEGIELGRRSTLPHQGSAATSVRTAI